MSTIGKITVSLEADYAQYSQGIGQAAKHLDKVGESGKHASAGVSSFFSSFAEGMGIGAGIELVTAGFEKAGEAIHEATERLVEWVGESMKGQQEAMRTAETLHMHVQTLEGLESAAKMAGVGSEQFVTALDKVNAKIGEAAQKGGEAQAAFTAIGLDAQKLAGQGMDQSLRQIADGLANIKNPAEQARVAAEIFGERVSGRLLPMLDQGAAGIDRFIERAKESGAALNDVDAGKVVAAQRGLDELGERFEGVKNQLTVALAPAIIAIGEKLMGIMPSAQTMQAYLTMGLRGVAVFAAASADAIAHLVAPILRVAAAAHHLSAEVTFGAMSRGSQAIADGLNHAADVAGNSNMADAVNKKLDEISAHADKIGKDLADGIVKPIAAAAPRIDDSAKKIEEILKHLQEQAGTSTGKPKELIDLQGLHASNEQLAKAKELMDQISQNKIKIEVDKSLGDLAKQIATFGMNEGQKKLFDLEAMGAGPQAIETAQTYLKQLDALEAHKKDADEAKKLIEQTQSPLDKYQKQLTDLKRLSAEGLINANQYAAALSKDNKELQDALKDPNADKKFAAETRRFNFAGPAHGPAKADPIERLAQQQKAQTDSVKKSEFYLSEIYRFQQNADQDAAETIDF